MKAAIKGYICATTYDWAPGDTFYSFQPAWIVESSNTEQVVIMPHEFEVDLPADFNLAAAQVARLEKRRDKLHDEFYRRLAELNEQISKLTALPYVPAEVL